MLGRSQNITPVSGLERLPSQAFEGFNNLSSAQKRRSKRLRLAIITSIGSKFATLGLQFLAIPIAVRSVSSEEFGIYTASAAILSFISLADLGLGPALTRKMAKAWAISDLKEQSRLFGNALVVVSGVLVIAVFAGASTILFHWFGFARVGSPISSKILWTVLTIGGLQLLCNPFIRLQAGFQQTYIGNLFACCGAAAAACALVICAIYYPSPVGFLWSVYGCAVLAQLLNSLLVVIQHPHLRTAFSQIDRPLIHSLIKDGFQFALPQTIAPMLLREGPKIVLISAGLAIETASYGVLTQLMLVVAGPIFMFTQPLLPALVEAETRGDLQWALKVWQRGKIGTLLVSICFTTGFLLLGPQFIHLYTGGKLSVSRRTLMAFCAYADLMYWNHLGFVFVSALGHISLFFKLAIAEISIMGIFLAFGMLQGTRSAFVCLAISMVITGLVWPFALKRYPPFANV